MNFHLKRPSRLINTSPQQACMYDHTMLTEQRITPDFFVFEGAAAFSRRTSTSSSSAAPPPSSTLLRRREVQKEQREFVSNLSQSSGRSRHHRIQDHLPRGSKCNYRKRANTPQSESHSPPTNSGVISTLLSTRDKDKEERLIALIEDLVDNHSRTN